MLSTVLGLELELEVGLHEANAFYILDLGGNDDVI